MTKYLETKTNSIEEAISSVVLGEAKFQVNYSKGGKLFSKTINAKDEDDAEDKAIKKFKIDDDDIRSVVKESLDEYTLTKLDKMMGIKKGDRVFFVSGSNAEGNVYAQNEKEAMEKAKKKGIKGKISIRDKGEYKGQPRLVNSVNEGYESEVLKVLKDADIEGYFKMGKLYVSRRDAKDAKKALEDSDEITKLPKMVMEVYEIGTPEYTKHTLEVTPGQSVNDVDEMLGITQKKRTSMREALAKMWGLDEGKNPFKKSEEKDLTKEGEHDKTLTGKKPTKVDVDPELKDK